jgi:hypothetical protein
MRQAGLDRQAATAGLGTVHSPCRSWVCHEADFDAAADEGGTLQGLMLTACQIERGLYDALLAATPGTVEGMPELVRYVDEVARQQSEKDNHDRGPEFLAANLKATVPLAA